MKAISPFEKNIISNLSIAMHHIENAYASLKWLLDNEDSGSEKERATLYNYGLEKAQINKVRLSNIKKRLLSVTDNKTISEE